MKISSLFDSIIETESVYSSDSDCDYTFTIEVLRTEKTRKQYFKALAENKDTLGYIEIEEEVVPVMKQSPLPSPPPVTGLGSEVIIETIVAEEEGTPMETNEEEQDPLVEIEELEVGEYVEEYEGDEDSSTIEPGEIVYPSSNDRIRIDQELREKLRKLREKIADPFVYCEECSKKFTNDKLLTLHKKLYHAPATDSIDMDLSAMKEFTCPVCNKYTSKNRFNFKMHLKLSHNTVVTGEEPGAGHRARARLLEPLRSVVSRVQRNILSEFLCNTCSKGFATLKQLETHMLMHENARNYICDVCSASFNVPEYLRIHRNQHVDIRCGICLDEFVFRKDYIRHHSISHAGLQKVCIINGELANPNHVPGRTKVPKTNEEFSCPDCGKSFYSRKGYQKHRCKGVEGSSYPCRIENCSFVAPSYEELKQHRHRLVMYPAQSVKSVKHEFGEETCPMCNRTYRSKKGFEMHRCKGDRMVTCPFPSCGMNCYNIGDYYEHVEEVHRNDVAKRPHSPDLNDCIEEEEV